MTSIFNYPMREIDGYRVIDAGFCEVGHMAKAQVQIALKHRATAATLVPYMGWDGIEPFLEAGLRVYVYPANRHWLLPRWPRLWRSWQRMARRRYGKGRLLAMPASREEGE